MGCWFSCTILVRGLTRSVATLALAAPQAPPRGAATPVATEITEVSVHRGSALVTRHGVVPEGSARVEVAGLPATLLPDSVRLRVDGGEANAIEVREARTAAAADPRIAELERRRDALVRAQEEAADRLALETALRARLEGLLDQEAALHAREVASGRANPSAWNDDFTWLDCELRAARKAERDALRAVESAKADVESAGAELGRLAQGGPARGFVVSFDVVAQRQGALDLKLDYLVQGASWTPRYDLRADRELRQVDLVYRAEVSQQSGEDWKAVDLWLSTAEPHRGVCGPKAQPLWLTLAPPERAKLGRLEARFGVLADAADDKEKGDLSRPGNPESAFAAVENEGLSVRYRLARKETIESRPGSSTVLVGRAALAVTGERVTTPALDPGVWLRGRTRNTSDYVLLPGPSAVFFGNDFVGPSALALVRPGQEFTLDLGLDAGLKVERVHVADSTGKAGFFRSKREKIDRWRIRVENHGALAAAGQRQVTVQVREVLPRVKDDKIEVELTDCAPKLATGGRFERDREERGVLTWELPVADGANAEIDWQSRIVWPEDDEIVALQGSVVPLVRGPAGELLVLALALAISSSGALVLRRALRRGSSRRHVTLPLVVGALGLALLAPSARAQQAVASRIERVTVFGTGALVERVATLPAAGSYVLRGLPAAADPASIRVRIGGGEVVGVEVRERRERALPDERLDALRAAIQKLAREKQDLEDERAALQSLAAHLAKLFTPAPPSPMPAVPPAGASAPSDDARPGARVWAADRDFLAARLAEQQKAARANEQALAAKERELEAARRSLQLADATSVVLRDVALDVAAAAGGELRCELSYLVESAGWAPAYELRAQKELTKVELTYRARVWQATAEAWDGVDLWLSTAQPQRGAAGPDPQPQWLTLRGRRPAIGLAAPAQEARRGDEAQLLVVEEERKIVMPAKRPPPFAAVSDEGLSVRFHLPDRATVAPGEQGQIVLVGRAELPLRPDRCCAPALDPTVWLEAKAVNSSDWVLLPGETAVHLGNDYLGKGTLALTRKGEEFDLALGADPFVTVERVALEDQRTSSALSSNGTQVHSWRLTFENHGAPSAAGDGSVAVRVQEALPRSRDERITVRLDAARPEPSTAKDDQKLRDERGLLTWRLVLPRAGKAGIEWRWSARFPEKERLYTTSD